MIPGEVKGEHSFLGVKHEPPGRARPAFVQILSQFPNRNPRMKVRAAKALPHQRQGGRNLSLATGIPDDLPEPLGKLNGNHLCRR